jgi:hypothetical protein
MSIDFLAQIAILPDKPKSINFGSQKMKATYLLLINRLPDHWEKEIYELQ